jgi:hypothetical protein
MLYDLFSIGSGQGRATAAAGVGIKVGTRLASIQGGTIPLQKLTPASTDGEVARGVSRVERSVLLPHTAVGG